MIEKHMAARSIVALLAAINQAEVKSAVLVTEGAEFKQYPLVMRLDVGTNMSTWSDLKVACQTYIEQNKLQTQGIRNARICLMSATDLGTKWLTLEPAQEHDTDGSQIKESEAAEFVPFRTRWPNPPEWWHIRELKLYISNDYASGPHGANVDRINIILHQEFDSDSLEVKKSAFANTEMNNAPFSIQLHKTQENVRERFQLRNWFWVSDPMLFNVGKIVSWPIISHKTHREANEVFFGKLYNDPAGVIELKEHSAITFNCKHLINKGKIKTLGQQSTNVLSQHLVNEGVIEIGQLGYSQAVEISTSRLENMGAIKVSAGKGIIISNVDVYGNPLGGTAQWSNGLLLDEEGNEVQQDPAKERALMDLRTYNDSIDLTNHLEKKQEKVAQWVNKGRVRASAGKNINADTKTGKWLNDQNGSIYFDAVDLISASSTSDLANGKGWANLGTMLAIGKANRFIDRSDQLDEGNEVGWLNDGLMILKANKNQSSRVGSMYHKAVNGGIMIVLQGDLALLNENFENRGLIYLQKDSELGILETSGLYESTQKTDTSKHEELVKRLSSFEQGKVYTFSKAKQLPDAFYDATALGADYPSSSLNQFLMDIKEYENK